MNKRPTILLIESSPVISIGLIHLLNESQEFELPLLLSSTDYLQQYLTSHKPDILILNSALTPCHKKLFFQNLTHNYPQLTLISLISQLTDSQILNNFHASIDIYTPHSHIIKIIKEAYISSHSIQDNEQTYMLTDRETEILILISKGLMNKEIADKLNISQHTVISHRKNITQKTGIKSVAGLTVYAMLHNLIK